MPPQYPYAEQQSPHRDPRHESPVLPPHSPVVLTAVGDATALLDDDDADDADDADDDGAASTRRKTSRHRGCARSSGVSTRATNRGPRRADARIR